MKTPKEISASLGSGDRPIKIYWTQMVDDSPNCDLAFGEIICELTINEARKLIERLRYTLELSDAQLALQRGEITKKEYFKIKWTGGRK